MEDQDIKNRIVRKMLRKQIVGNHKKQIDSIVNMCLPSHEQGRGKELLEDMATDPHSPVEMYGGGHRQNVRLIFTTSQLLHQCTFSSGSVRSFSTHSDYCESLPERPQ